MAEMKRMNNEQAKKMINRLAIKKPLFGEHSERVSILWTNEDADEDEWTSNFTSFQSALDFLMFNEKWSKGFKTVVLAAGGEWY